MAELELYFTDDQGGRWRVHDVAYGPPLAQPFKYKQLLLGDTRARYRLFVPEDRDAMRRSFDFNGAAATRGLTLDVIAAQFAKSAYVPRSRQKPEPRPPGTPLGQ